MTRKHLSRSLLICGTFLGLLASSASAGQDPPLQSQPGPLVVERIDSGFVVAPDLKVTNVNDTLSTLMGAYGGWMKDDTLLVGAGAYWLTNGSDDLKMWYGGLVLGWQMRADRRIGFGGQGLVGFGEATLPSAPVDFARTLRGGALGRFSRGPASSARVGFERQFFIVEPEATVLVKLTSWIRFNGGVGYRVIAGANGAEEQLRGITGSVALQMGQ